MELSTGQVVREQSVIHVEVQPWVCWRPQCLSTNHTDHSCPAGDATAHGVSSSGQSLRDRFPWAVDAHRYLLQGVRVCEGIFKLPRGGNKTV